MIKKITIYRNNKKFTNNSLRIDKKKKHIFIKCNIGKKDYEWFILIPFSKIKYNDKKLSIKFVWIGKWTDEIYHKKTLCKCDRVVNSKYHITFKEVKDYNKVKMFLSKKKLTKKKLTKKKSK